MSIYAIGDVHLSLDNTIDKPMGVFGKEWENHTERLKENWLETVREEDTIILAGDISWGLKLEEAVSDLDFLAELPGHKVIIKGNHDLWWNGITRLNSMYDSMTFIQNSCYEADGWFICGSRGWTCPGSDDFSEADERIFKREVGRLRASLEAARSRGAENIIGVTHYPPTNDKLQPSEFTKLFTEAGVDTALYGHLHGNEGYKNGIKGHLNGVDYQLISLDYLDCRIKKIK